MDKGQTRRTKLYKPANCAFVNESILVAICETPHQSLEQSRWSPELFAQWHRCTEALHWSPYLEQDLQLSDLSIKAIRHHSSEDPIKFDTDHRRTTSVKRSDLANALSDPEGTLHRAIPELARSPDRTRLH